MTMAKQVQLPDDVYEQLKEMKVGDESFGSVIRRILADYKSGKRK